MDVLAIPLPIPLLIGSLLVGSASVELVAARMACPSISQYCKIKLNSGETDKSVGAVSQHRSPSLSEHLPIMRYRKSSSKNIIGHFRSAHPHCSKKATARSVFRTAALMSSNKNLRSSSMTMASRIALLNRCVPEEVVDHQQQRYTLLRR